MEQALIVWHAMDRDLGKAFEELVACYNALPEVKAKKVTISHIYKGNYDQTLALMLASEGRRNSHILFKFLKWEH